MKIKKLSLVFIFLLMLAGAFAQNGLDTIGTHYKDAVSDSKISVRQGSFWDSINSFFDTLAIATQNSEGSYVGSFQPGNLVNFHVDVTSFNTVCKSTAVVAEIYDTGGIFKKASSFSIGQINGGNNYFIADIPYQISTTETSFGTWTGVGYLWCTDNNQIISSIYKTSFSINKAGTTCPTSYSGGLTCRSDLSTTSANGQDAYRLYTNADCSTTYNRTYQCTATQNCQAGACVGSTNPGGPGYILPGTNPPIIGIATPLTPSTNTDYTWWIIGFIAIVILLFTGLGKKFLGMFGVKLR